MDGIAFLKQLPQTRLSGAYYFCGTEPYSLKQAERAVVSRTNPDLRDMNVARLKAPSASDVKNACDTLPFFDELRVVIVSEFDADTANALETYITTVPETTVLLLLRPGEPPKTNPLFKAMEQRSRVVSFDRFTEGLAADFAAKRAAECGAEIDRAAANLIVSYVGVDLGALENTARMLAGYVGQGGKITVKAVEACVSPSTEYRVFRIIDCLWAGNKREGLGDLMRLVKSPSESPLGAATLFERNFRQAFQAKQLLENGKTDREAEAALGGSFIAQKAVRNAKKRTLGELADAIDAFAGVDRLQKSGEQRADDALFAACCKYFI